MVTSIPSVRSQPSAWALRTTVQGYATTVRRTGSRPSEERHRGRHPLPTCRSVPVPAYPLRSVRPAPAVSDDEIAGLLRTARLIAAAECLIAGVVEMVDGAGDSGVMIPGEERP